MSKNENSSATGMPVTTRQASASRGTTSVPQGKTPGQGSTPGQASAATQPSTATASSTVRPSTAQASSKTYVGVCVYIDVDGTIKPERIALGNRLFGISCVVDVKDVRSDGRSNGGSRSNDGGGNGSLNTSNILIKDYTVEIWNGKGKTLTSHLFMENSGTGLRWYVMQKAKASSSV